MTQRHLKTTKLQPVDIDHYSQFATERIQVPATIVKSKGVDTCARINAMLKFSGMTLVAHTIMGTAMVHEVWPHEKQWKKIICICDDGAERTLYLPWYEKLELYLGQP